MGIKTEWLRYGPNRAFLGFAAYPEATGPLPAVVVFQEAWGVDAHIQDVTGRVARAGYFAFAPDLFAFEKGERPAPLTDERLLELKEFVNTLPPGAWHKADEKEAALNKLPESRRGRIAESMAAMTGTIAGNQDPHLVATTAFLRNENGATKGQKVAATGFCMGGGRAARLAGLDPALAGAVSFYGQPPADDLIPKIGCPVIAFHGGEDKGLVAGVSAFEEKMKAAGKQLTVKIYEGAKHAFLNDTRPAYDVGATRDSWVRLLTFLQAQLAR